MVLQTRLSRANVEGGAPLVTAYSAQGFNLKGVQVVGSVALLPKGFFHWRINSASDITPESMSLFTLIEPKLGRSIIIIIMHINGIYNNEFYDCLMSHIHIMFNKCLYLPELVVLGTGSKLVNIDTAVKRYLQRNGISIEIQDTVS